MVITAGELARFLLREPERIVQVETADAILGVLGAEFDRFADEPPCVVLTLEEDVED